MKGYRQSKEHIAKRTQPRIGKKYKPYSEETRKGLIGRQKGMKRPSRSKEHRRKLSEVQKGNKHWNWQGGKVEAKEVIRQSIEFRLWREAVYARDNWTCQKYGIRGIKLHPHHIKNFAQFPELRFAIDNGITLSEKAHKEFHHIYGRKNNTKEQLEEFLK